MVYFVLIGIGQREKGDGLVEGASSPAGASVKAETCKIC